MRKLTAALASMLLAFSIFGQTQQIDALQKALSNSSDFGEKSSIAAQLSEQFRTSGNLASAADFAEKSLDLAKKSGKNSQIANALDEQGRVFQQKFDYENAMRAFVDAMKLRDEATDPAGFSKSKNLIGRVFFQQGDFQSAKQNLEKALEIRMAQKDLAAAAVSNQFLGDVFLAQKIFGKAQEHFRTALEQKIEAEDINGAAQIASFLGKLSNELGDGDGAIVYFRQSLDLNQSTENLPKMAADFTNITEALFHQGNFDEAFSTCQTAKKIAAEVRDSVQLAAGFKNEGLIFSKKGDKLAAARSFDTASIVLSALRGVGGTSEIWQQTATGYREIGQLDKAFVALTAFNRSRDAVFSSEKNKALLELTTRFESEFAAAKQKQQIEKLELEQATAGKIRFGLLGLLALGCLAIWALFRMNLLKKRDNILLKSKNDEIDAKNQELDAKNQSLDILNAKLVDEIAERENMEKTSFAREKFLARVSQEMRTPMNNILGLSRELLENSPRPEQSDALRNLQFMANSLVVSINDMLDFSKIETGKLTLETVEFDPSKIVFDVENRFSAQLNAKKVTFKVDYDPQIPAKLVGDPTRLNQILTNLISASANTTDAGEVAVQIGLQEFSSKEALLKVSIRDTGHGISPTELDRVLHPETDLEEIFEEIDGQNLGLAMTKRLIDLQNGRLEARSTEGGSAYLLWLPFQMPMRENGRPDRSAP